MKMTFLKFRWDMSVTEAVYSSPNVHLIKRDGCNEMTVICSLEAIEIKASDNSIFVVTATAC